jgi:arginyl-tRNA synthetase
LGKAYVVGYAAYEDNPAAKEEIDAINKKLYAKDPAYAVVYQDGRRVSLEHFADLYRVLGTSFNKYYFESDVADAGIAMVHEGLQKGIFEESEGAIVYRAEKHGLHTRVFITKQGTPTYEAKELGLMTHKRQDVAYDLNITTVAVEQDSYFKVVEKAMDDLIPEIAGRYTHVAFGMMQLTSGKMSSRKGNVITGESLLAEMRTRAFEKMGDRDLGERKAHIADQVAVAAIKYSILKQGLGKNIIFNPESSLSFDGDSGPYLQYAHTRALSVLRRARAEGVQGGSGTSLSVSPLEKVLYRFPEVVLRAQREYEPHHVTTYLTQLAGTFNAWYANEKIVDPQDPESPYRIMLTECFANTMHRGLWLLGIEAPESM